MAMSVKRRIERNLSNVMGQRDPARMIRVRSTDTIRASGLVPRQQAGHMTASDLTCRNAKKTLASWGPSTHDDTASQSSWPDGTKLGSGGKAYSFWVSGSSGGCVNSATRV